MDLENKNAIIYGAGGSLGSAVAKALARAGAMVFLTGIRTVSVQKTANEIIEFGGKVVVDKVDGFNETEINNHIQKVIELAGTVDISFNAVGIEVKQNIPLVNLSSNDFVQPVTQTLQTRFLTAKAAAIVMMRQRSGVILSLTATPGGIGYPYTGGFSAACVAVETFATNLAAELGVYGIRVVNIRSAGSPDSKVFKQAIESHPKEMEPILKKMEADTMLKKLPSMMDIANTAVFLCSPLAASITGVTIDVTAGTTSALNYKVTIAP